MSYRTQSQTSSKERRVLLISHDTIGHKMAGPGIRYYHLATVLARHFDLRLAIPCQPEQLNAVDSVDLELLNGRICRYVRGDWSTISQDAQWAEVVILPSDTATDFPQLAMLEQPLVIDGYDPLLMEWLALLGAEELQNGASRWRQRMQQLDHQYGIGDFYICASERQRDWWLGLLEAHGRINPWTFCEDPSLRRLVDTVPYGLPDTLPRATRRTIKGIWPGIATQDRVILWGGGLWLWLDPLTAIRAVARVWQHRQDVRLIFPGTRHPNPVLSEIGSHNAAAKTLAADLGLLDRAVFFGDWVPYEDWANVLLESDIALSLHFDTAETRLAFRSRVLEYIWAGLPSVVSRGDATSDLVNRYALGAVVDYQDVDGVTKAILEMLDTTPESRGTAFAQARQDLRWENVARPLIEFCRQPRRAADRLVMGGQVENPARVKEVEALKLEVDQLARQVSQLEAEITHQADLLCRYEKGRFMRSMRWLHEQKQMLQRLITRLN